MNGFLPVFVDDFHFVLLFFVIFLVLIGLFDDGLRFLKKFEELNDVVFDFFLFFLDFIVISFGFFLLISVGYDKVNVFLFALLEFIEVGLFGFD